MKKTLTLFTFLVLIAFQGFSQAEIRIISVDAEGDSVTLKNLGDVAQDISDYNFCLGPGNYNVLNNYSSLNGDLDLSPDEEVTIDITSGTLGVTSFSNTEGLGLFATASFGSSDPAVLLDYVQWGGANQDRVSQAVTAGRWDNAANFVQGGSPFRFNGTAGEFGSAFWSGEATIRLTSIDLVNQSVTLKNLGSAEEDLSGYFFCLGPGRYNQLNAYDSIVGDLNVPADGEVTLLIRSATAGVDTLGAAEGLGLFNKGGVFGSSSPDDIEDYIQWGGPNQDRVDQAVAAGRWSDTTQFVSGPSPYVFIGAADDVGPDAWRNSDAIIRITSIDLDNQTVTLRNFSAFTEDVSGYWFCLGPGSYNQLNNYTTIEGDLELDSAETVTITITSGGGNVDSLEAEAGLGLFNKGGAFASTSPDDLEDFLQWGAPGQPRVDQAVTAGRWDDTTSFVAGAAPFNFVGEATSVGAAFWIDDTAIRLTRIIPETDEVVVQNFDTVSRDLTNYWFCTLAGIYPQLGNELEVEVLEGDLDLSPGESVRVKVLTQGGVVDSAGSIFLFSSAVLGFNNQNQFTTRDFAQWGAGNGFRVDNAVAAGRWDDAASFIPGASPFDYNGGADDIGAAFWIGDAIIRITQINLENQTATIQNLGTIAEDVSEYWFCLGPGAYNQLNNYSTIDGDLNLDPDEAVTFTITSGGGNVNTLESEAGLGLFTRGGAFGSTNPDDFEDYVQWGAPNQARVDQAVSAGRWDSSENIAEGVSPYQFNGGANDFGSSFWEGTVTSTREILRPEIQLFPNPATDFIRLTNDAGDVERVRVVDWSGKVVRFLDGVRSNPVQVNMDQLPRGIYLVEILNAQNQLLQIGKVVKQ